MILQWILFVLTMLGGLACLLFYLSARDSARRAFASLDEMRSLEKDWEQTAMAAAARLRAENAALREELAKLRAELATERGSVVAAVPNEEPRQ